MADKSVVCIYSNLNQTGSYFATEVIQPDVDLPAAIASMYPDRDYWETVKTMVPGGKGFEVSRSRAGGGEESEGGPGWVGELERKIL